MEEICEVDEGGMRSFDILSSSEKTISMLRDECWLQTAKQDGD